MDDPWVIAIIVAALVILALVAWVIVRRRSRAGGVIAAGHAGPAGRSEGRDS